MAVRDLQGLDQFRRKGDRFAALLEDNQILREEIRVAHEAAEITARMVVEQFEKTDAILAQFRNTSSQLEAVLDAATQISIIAADRNGTILLFNRGAERMLGHAAREIVGRRTPLDLHPPAQLHDWLVRDNGGEITLAHYFAVLAQSGTFESTYLGKDGRLIPINLSVTPIEDTEGHVTGYLSVAMDITPLKDAEERQRRAKEEVERANRHLKELDKMKSDLLSSVSHELRTPLTSIRGFAQLIYREFERSFAVPEASKLHKKSARILENLSIILVEADRLTRLINNVLDLAKIESGRIEWNDRTFALQDAVRQAVNAVRGQFEAKPRVGLRVEAPDEPLVVNADYDRMVQVIVNLLNNAAKFTEEGEVAVEVLRDEDGRIRTCVRDTGVGFDPDKAEAIFDKFRQLTNDDTLVDKPQGTGLGLSICREIVTHYGGRIWAESQPGVGSRFILTLPPFETAVALEAVGIATGPAGPGAPKAIGAERAVILVVDDEAPVRTYLAQLLQENGYAVVTANDGRQAIEAATQVRPDLITMDLAMPVMDGRTAITRLRKDPELGRIPVIVLSAVPGYETAGGNIALGKPIDERILLDGMRLLLGARKSWADRLPASVGIAATPCLVLCDPRKSARREIPPVIATGDVIACSRFELMERIRDGFQGLIVVPAELLPDIDEPFLKATAALQILILPTEGDVP
ncbi:MAG: response regulator [Rhodospirillales bacterium]|nr:response regulator [Rhodospirillales bacterium]